jgi:hypothetical protein
VEVFSAAFVFAAGVPRGTFLVSRAPGGQAYENDFAFRHVFDN